MGAPRFFDRQRRFAPIGEKGQTELRRARAAIVGLGALGSVMAERLTRAGVGHLALIDRDFVEESNLGTQALYTLQDAEELLPKAVAAEAHLREIHPAIAVAGIVADLNPENAEELLGGVDLVLDGTDNFETRMLINDVCLKHEIPWVYCAVVEGYGQTMTIVPQKTACLRCLYPEPPKPGTLPTCETGGLINPISGALAAFSAAEALKLIVGSGRINSDLLYVDIWEGRWRRFPVERPPDCTACVHRRFEHLEAKRGTSVTTLCGRDAVQLRSSCPQRLDLVGLAERLRPLGEVLFNGHLLRFCTGSVEMVVFPDGRAIIHGICDPTAARGFYARYIGS